MRQSTAQMIDVILSVASEANNRSAGEAGKRGEQMIHHA
jgi:hypothetical protein